MTERELPDWVDGFVEFTDNSEPAQMFRMWTAISCVAAVMRRKCFLPWGSLTFYPNMYVVLVAPSGGRKGTAMGPGHDMLRELGIKMTAEAITREALIRELSSAQEQYMELETGATVVHSSLTIFSQELTVFLGYNNSQLLSDLTDWFDCRNQWTYRTKTQGTDQITGVWVNLIGATTPSLIESSMAHEAIGGGLTSRMIFVFEHKRGKIVALPWLSPSDVELKGKLLRDLERIALIDGKYEADETFIGRWVPWYESTEENPPFRDDRFAGYMERRAMHLLKLSMILNAARTNEMIITEQDFDKALAVLEATEKKMPLAFSGVGRAANVDLLVKVMSEITIRKEASFNELISRFYMDADKFTLTKVMETLESMDFVVYKRGKYAHTGKDCGPLLV
jgi:hypothetical protein